MSDCLDICLGDKEWRGYESSLWFTSFGRVSKNIPTVLIADARSKIKVTLYVIVACSKASSRCFRYSTRSVMRTSHLVLAFSDCWEIVSRCWGTKSFKQQA